MSKIVGIFKELRPEEELGLESKAMTPTIFLKEMYLKGPIRHSRRECPVSLAYTNVYLTNERLAFLVMYQQHAADLAQKTGSSRMSGMAGTWFEIPLTAINQVEERPVQLSGRRDLKDFLNRSDAEAAKSLLYAPPVTGPTTLPSCLRETN
jgi:hypothetical protein